MPSRALAPAGAARPRRSEFKPARQVGLIGEL